MGPKPALHIGILAGKPEEEPPADGEGGGDYVASDGEKLAIHELASAFGVHVTDVDKACKALSSFFKIVDKEPHEEGPNEDEEHEPPEAA